MLVDDSDTLRIWYSDEWVSALGVVDEFNSTSHRTTSKGSTATFRFNGTGVSVFGTIPPNDLPGGPSISSYTLDDIPSVFFTAEASSVPIFRQLFYQSPLLPDTHHQLIITTLNDDSEFGLDYLLHNPSASGDTAGSSAVTSKVKKTQGVSSGAFAGAIAGGTVFVILLILTAYLFYRRRKRPRVYAPKGGGNRRGSMSTLPEITKTIEPYTLTIPPPTYVNGRMSRHISAYKPDYEKLVYFDVDKRSVSPTPSPLTGVSLHFFPPPTMTEPTRRPPSSNTSTTAASPLVFVNSDHPYDQLRA